MYLLDKKESENIDNKQIWKKKIDELWLNHENMWNNCKLKPKKKNEN